MRTDPDQTWKYHRNLIKPFFTSESSHTTFCICVHINNHLDTEQRIRDVKLERIDNLISQFLKYSNSNEPVDVFEANSRMMFDISLEYFFGFTNVSLKLKSKLFHMISYIDLLRYIRMNRKIATAFLLRICMLLIKRNKMHCFRS